jgi:hypothetical protein
VSQLQVEAEPEVSGNRAFGFFLPVLAGPSTFLIVQSIPLAELARAHGARGFESITRRDELATALAGGCGGRGR